MDPSPVGVALKLAGVSLSRGGRPSLERIDLAVAGGEIRVLFGANGAGKTTLLRLVAGLEPPGSGEIAIGGRTVSSQGRILVPPHARGVAMAFQEQALWPHMTVEAHLRFGLDRRIPDPRERDARVGEALAFVGLASHRRERPGQLSGGEQQRLELARALAQPAQLVLLDEPTAHLDLASRRPLTRDLAALLRARGSTVVWVTHSLDEIDVLGGTVSILDAGRLSEELPAHEMKGWLRAREAAR